MIHKFLSLDFITKIVVLDAIFVMIFTIIVGIATFTTQYEPSIYIGCVYTACLGEGGLTALLKITKRGGDNDE